MSDAKPVSTLGQAAVTNIVTALAESLTNAKNSASALIGFCNAAAKAKLARTPNEADVVCIVDALAAKLNWNGTPREKVSKSEARNLVRQHAYIPELQTALRASEHGACSYHDAVKLSRLMKEHGNVGAAVIAFNTKAPKGESDTFKRFTLALQAHYQTVSEGKAGKDKTKLLSALAQCAEAFKIETVKA